MTSQAVAILSRAEEVSTEALRLASVEPGRALDLAVQAERTARTAGDWAAESMAKRAHGVAAMHLGDLDDAVVRLRESVAAGRRAGSSRLVGEARMSLASALTLRRSPGPAFREIEAALRELDGVFAARAMVQRSAILQEMGRFDEALEAVRPALPLLRRFGDVQWETRALNNRSMLHRARRSFGAAEADLVAALALCVEHELDLPRAYVEQNLGSLKADKGDVPAALAHFDRAEELYRRLGAEVGSLLIDRARVLLSIRLVAEARATAEAAVRACERQKRMNLPEARLMLSTVALVEGDLLVAQRAADEATHEFTRLGRHEWLALARYARLQARMAQDRSRVTPAQARRSAEELTAAGWIVPALEARVMSGVLELDRGRRSRARLDLELASRARSTGPADARARAWLAEALLRRADGRRTGAVRAISAGLRILREHQTTLGATELRAHTSAHRGGLARLGVRIALEGGDARGVYRWTEEGRATATLLRPVHPPDDPVLAPLLTDLRTTLTAIERRRGSGQPTAALVQRQVALERRIRDHSRTSAGAAAGSADDAPVAPCPIQVLAGELGPAALVEYTELDGKLHAVTVVDGRVRLYGLNHGPESTIETVQQSLRQLTFGLRRLADPRTQPDSVAAAGALLDRANRVLDELLLRPLERAIADRPLVIIPTGLLQSLPWSLLPSCAGRPVVVAPSATLWHLASRRTVPDRYARVVVVAGPGLPGAYREAAAVADLYAGATRLVDGNADAARVTAAMTGATLVHVAAHGQLRSDNPQFSALRLADGPFTVYDLELLRDAPHHVVLAACDTAQSHVVAGEEVLGLTSALLSQGTAALVAPVIPVPDIETVSLMRAYHSDLRAGRAPADALARAQERTRAEGPQALAAAAGFVCLGAGLDPTGQVTSSAS
jgi:tetratricopeptide (TPR) repeat protein